MKLWLSLCLLSFAVASQAAIQEKKVSYQYDDDKMTGYLYWDDAVKGKRPGVLVIHEWWGLNDYAKKRAHMLAELGYVAFAADMYGGNKVTTTPDQAREWMQAVTADVEGWRERALAGHQQLLASGMVDEANTAAIGYCFGGATVLQMSYSNAPVKGVVSFHGALPAAPAEMKGKIKPQILVLHGHADSFVAPEVVTNFRNKLDEAEAVWEMNTYGNAKHGFTNPDAGKAGIEALEYNEMADKRSWKRMQVFFKEIF
jgi:dienelactone hydrolase